ncbi:MAG: LytR C-terminal domain-containing protein [Bifidobacteriaceae bacterium]|nr:LytR C-terminal domain-containing protein [Bifidobacteriaceae bacterium]
MAKNAYPYPPDEFDQVDLEARPKEVHAARRGPWSRVWPFLLVIVLIPAITFAAVYYFGDRLNSSTAPTSPPPTSASPADQPAETPTPAGEVTPETPAEEPTPEPPAAVVDKSIKVTVYNAGETQGAAGTAAETLKTAGYANADKAFPPNPADPAASTVYYSVEDQALTASDVASTLGVAATELDAQVAGGNIVVVVR